MLSLVGKRVEVRPSPGLSQALKTWMFLDIEFDVHTTAAPTQTGIERIATAIADQEGCSVLYDFSGVTGPFRVGLLAQRRFWMPSRARLIADEVLLGLDRAEVEEAV